MPTVYIPAEGRTRRFTAKKMMSTMPNQKEGTERPSMLKKESP